MKISRALNKNIIASLRRLAAASQSKSKQPEASNPDFQIASWGTKKTGLDPPRNEKGLTVLELLVVSGISLVIASAIFMAMRLGNEQLDTSNLKMTIQDSAREGLYKMLQEIRESAPSRIAIGGGGSSIQFIIPDPNNPVIVPGYTVNWAGAHTIQYAVAGTQIQRRNLTTNQNSVMANDVTGMTFTGNLAQPTVVTVTMNVQKNLKNNRVVPNVPLQMTGQARIRNP